MVGLFIVVVFLQHLITMSSDLTEERNGSYYEYRVSGPGNYGSFLSKHQFITIFLFKNDADCGHTCTLQGMQIIITSKDSTVLCATIKLLKFNKAIHLTNQNLTQQQKMWDVYER